MRFYIFINESLHVEAVKSERKSIQNDKLSRKSYSVGTDITVKSSRHLNKMNIRNQHVDSSITTKTKKTILKT